MNRVAFIYPGQGTQRAGMGADFYKKSPLAKEIFDTAGEVLGLDMKALCFEENDKLDLTEYTQPALVTVCLAITAVLKERGIKPDITAGHSLGEYCGISAAGGMKPIDAIRLVRKRGILMQSAVPAGLGTMCAVAGMENRETEAVLDQIEGVTIAGYNCPGQVVITGKNAAVKEAGNRLKALGGRIVPLKVSGPFHSPMLKEAGRKLRKELERTELSPFKIPYVTNVTAEIITDISRTRELLPRQVSAPVLWMQSVETMLAAGVHTFIEIGPGKTLAGFIREIDKTAVVKNVGTWEEMEQVCAQTPDRQMG